MSGLGRVLFLGKRGDRLGERALDLLLDAAPETEALFGGWGDPLPSACADWRGELIVSYLAPWIVPERLLERADEAINFHPGPPEYPGIGCTNFAIYNRETEYGVTCHRMLPRVDSGEILAVRRFELRPDDTVLALTRRAYESIFGLFQEVLARRVAGEPLEASGESWARRPYRRTELDALCRVSPEMEDDEIVRRVRAVTYPGKPGAWVELAGIRFEARSPEAPEATS